LGQAKNPNASWPTPKVTKEEKSEKIGYTETGEALRPTDFEQVSDKRENARSCGVP